MSADADRAAFAERLRLQVQARYPQHQVSADPNRFGLRLSGVGIDLSLPLAPLHMSVRRQPDRTGALIAEYVRNVEHQLTPAVQAGQFSLKRALWCVRSRGYLDELSRAGELLTHPIGTDMLAFVAETLPGSIMRGVPREEWSTQGVDDAGVSAAATENTRDRFARVHERLRASQHVTRDGWRLSGDQLFQGSVVMVPEFLAALAERAQSDVLIAIPDRSLLLAIPVTAEGAERFRQRVTQAYREAMTPCSRELLITDGTQLHSAPQPRPKRGGLLSWLEA